jgi:KipI family sensor histidine kinase inhibitor
VIVLPYGDAAVLVEPEEPTGVLALRGTAAALDGVLEVVPAARTLLVRFDPRATNAAVLRAALAHADAAKGTEPRAAGPTVELPVRYDGADLDATAAEIGCDVASLVARHAAAEYTVAFCGFSPGFAYLTGLEPGLQVPRLASPRTSVPAGSVAIAGEYTGVYPRSSPGGWRLLGRTDAALWDLRRTPPALLAPDVRVRFVPR